MSLSVVNWNVEWATPAARPSAEILRRIDAHEPEVVCLTETHEDLLSRDGYTICSRPDYGHQVRPGRRKVLLWSREPWRNVDDLGIAGMPPGRFVSGVTRTSVGDVTVIGVCIPWSGSRVRGAGVKRRMWEDHGAYLDGLAKVLERSSERLIVMGDFNQRIGQRGNVPLHLRSALQGSFPSGMTIATSAVGLRGRRTIDHIAVGDDMAVEHLDVIDNVDGKTRLSDHFGVVAALSAA